MVGASSKARESVVRRLGVGAVLLGVLSVVLFYLLHLMPGSPAELLLASNPDLSGEDIDRIRKLRGLDRPIHEQYLCWLVGRGSGICDGAWPTDGILFGDLGYSTVHHRPVSELLFGRLGRTLVLMVPAFSIAVILSIVLGAYAAHHAGRGLDRIISGFVFVGLSLPVHWFAMVAILVFSVGLSWFPPSGVDDPVVPSFGARVHHAVLPVAVLCLYYVGRWTRHVRGAVREELRQPYLDAARMKGLSERSVIFRHALPNALLPFVTVVAQSMPVMFSGALVIEQVFSYPGMGLLIFESVDQRDYLVAIVVLLIYAALTFFAALVADLLYALLDPRVRIGLGASESSP